MYQTPISKLLQPASEQPRPRWAIVDCAATDADNSIFSKLMPEHVEKHNLFTGERAWTNDHVAPYLVPLDDQPQLEQWLIEKGEGVFFISDADSKILLAHLGKGRDIQQAAV